MSHPNIIVGVIQEAFPSYRPTDWLYFHKANDAALALIPTDDSWPPLCQAMLSVTGEDSLHGSFRGRRLICVHAHLNDVVSHLDVWVSKFEGLLRQIYWVSAEVLLLQTWFGECRIRYTAPKQVIIDYSGPSPKPPTAWRFAVTGIDRSMPCNPYMLDMLRNRDGFCLPDEGEW